MKRRREIIRYAHIESQKNRYTRKQRMSRENLEAK